MRGAGRAFVGGYRRLVDSGAFEGGPGQVQVPVQGPNARIGTLVLAGTGNPNKQGLETVRTAAARALRRARDVGARSVTMALPHAQGRSRRETETAEALVEGALLGLYRFEAYKGKKGERAKACSSA